MAYVYKGLDGMPFQEWLAHHEGVQNALKEEAFAISVRAKANLAKHKHDGHAYIELKHGDVDWYIVLNDDRGQHAAHIIEFGREEYEVEKRVWDAQSGRWRTREYTVGEMKGLRILRDAV